jgi:3-oxoacyl-[acyl-carrier protein] reductase
MKGVILITGTSTGLGRHLAEHHLAAGWKVAGCSRGAGGPAHPDYTHFQVDVTDEAAVTAMVGSVLAAHGRIDALLNNAGIAAMNPLLLTPVATARRILDTNFSGTFLFLREVGKAMVRQKSGRIVNFTTVAVPLNLEGEAIYAASKAAVESLTRVAARELGPHGITVNAVGPTPVPTALTRAVPPEKIEALVARQAIRRRGELSDVANVVDFFLQPGSDFITGQVIYLGGVTS